LRYYRETFFRLTLILLFHFVADYCRYAILLIFAAFAAAAFAPCHFDDADDMSLFRAATFSSDFRFLSSPFLPFSLYFRFLNIHDDTGLHAVLPEIAAFFSLHSSSIFLF